MKMLKVLAALSLYVAFSAASAQSVTYDYTGTVNEVNSNVPIPVAKGDTVTGTYTIDLAAGVPSEGFGTPGDQFGQWAVESNGGPAYGLPTPSAIVFSDTIQAGGFSYATPSAPYVSPATHIEGLSGGVNSGYFASESMQSANGDTTQSGFNLYGLGGPVPYNLLGLPLYSSSQILDYGYVQSLSGQSGDIYVQYSITSLTPASVVSAVPQTSTYVWLVFGLGLIGFMVHSKKRAMLPSGFA
jgi:hypothetical protein